jgi:hypothetical protein
VKGRVTIFECATPLAKQYSLNSAGELKKEVAAYMTQGTFRVVEFEGAADLAVLLESVGTSEALCASLPVNGRTSGRVVAQKMLADNPGALARTKRHFALPARPGLLFLDSDDGTMARDELWRALCDALPGLPDAAVVWRPSGSSNICRGADDLTGLKGMHVHVGVADASDGPRVVNVLAQRLWLAGFGRIVVSKAGSLLLRCPIDTAPADAARLIFSGGALTEPPLEQRRGPPVILSDGGFVDTRALVPDLSAEEEARYVTLVAQAKAAKAAEAAERKAAHRAQVIARRVPELIRSGIPASDAEHRISSAVDAAYARTLLGDFELTVVHDDGQHEAVTVGQVLADRVRWHETDCLDPLNPEHRGGAPDSRLYLLGASPIAYSLDDGGKVYRLRTARQRVSVSKGARHEVVQQLVGVVAGLDCVFRTDTGPVVVNDDGRQSPLSVENLMNLVGHEVELVVHLKNGTAPTDLQRETASLVLAALRA